MQGFWWVHLHQFKVKKRNKIKGSCPIDWLTLTCMNSQSIYVWDDNLTTAMVGPGQPTGLCFTCPPFLGFINGGYTNWSDISRRTGSEATWLMSQEYPKSNPQCIQAGLKKVLKPWEGPSLSLEWIKYLSFSIKMWLFDGMVEYYVLAHQLQALEFTLIKYKTNRWIIYV